MRLLTPTGPERCVVCYRPDWLNNKGLCPSCWLKWGSTWVVMTNHQRESFFHMRVKVNGVLS